MKKRITLKRDDCWDLPFGATCGCPLFVKMEEEGFAVKSIDNHKRWTDIAGKRHTFKPPFTEIEYADLLTRKRKTFSTTVSDED